jgi:hypothetical protein
VTDHCVFSLLALPLPLEIESLEMMVNLQFAAFGNLVLVVLTLLVTEEKFIHVVRIYFRLLSMANILFALLNYLYYTPFALCF